MGARLVVDFKQDGKTIARIYDHWAADNTRDASAVLHAFIRAVRAQCTDHRFGDAHYLAAKYVVWRAIHYNDTNYSEQTGTQPLSFLSVGIIPSTDSFGAECFAEVRALPIHAAEYPIGLDPRLFVSKDGVEYVKADPEIPYLYEVSAARRHKMVGDAMTRFQRSQKQDA
ncbi:hypothetical protein [Acidiphilium angustum]|uniref:hypothetical protein n=1 Tax=Acidiphilium angustum TaxID=523 RepID=UPI0004949F1A|nr:hypothetical protein [Acidiphilium angustum]